MLALSKHNTFINGYLKIRKNFTLTFLRKHHFPYIIDKIDFKWNQKALAIGIPAIFQMIKIDGFFLFIIFLLKISRNKFCL